MAERKQRKRRGQGEGAIYQRQSDGKWCAAVTLGYVAGKRRRKVIYGDTRREVADKLRKALHDHSQGINIAPERMTVEVFLERWLDDVVRLRVKPQTEASYRGMCERYLIPLLGRCQVRSLTRQDVQAFIGSLTNQGIAPGTVKLICAVLKSALAQAVDWGLLPRNPADGATMPRAVAYDAHALSPAEIQQLLAAMRGDRLEALYLTALTLGLRRGEVLGLRWQDIDFTASLLRVTGSLNHAGKRGDTKTASSRRTLPLPEFLADLLAIHHQHQGLDQAAAGEQWNNEQDLVFTTVTGRPVLPPTLHGYWAALLQRAGLPHMRFHDLRHSCASLLAALGVHPRMAMAILGHSSIAMTQNVYTHVADEGLREVAALLHSALSGDKEARKKS